MNNFLSVLFNHLADRRKERQFEAFRSFLEAYQASHAWTLLKCPMCQKPATAPDARFCASCGASLYVSSAKLHPAFEQERNTGPMQKRPLLEYLEKEDQERKRNTGPHTNYHRAVHLKKVTNP